jgi:excisionase family DNA binding protein
MEAMEQRLLTIAEAARMLALRPGTLRSWCYQRRLSRVRVGKRSVRIPLSEIRRIIAEGTEPMTAERA